MVAELSVPIIHLNHDFCPGCGNISLPRPKCEECAHLMVICVECGAAVERGATAPRED